MPLRGEVPDPPKEEPKKNKKGFFKKIKGWFKKEHEKNDQSRGIENAEEPKEEGNKKSWK